MASKHILEGLIKWSTRDRWADRFERILEDHEKERCAIIHDQMDRHYHRVLDEPVPALGGETPRSAVKTESGRGKVSDWLKMMENRTAKSGVHDSAMASYNFSWLWTELGISELTR